MMNIVRVLILIKNTYQDEKIGKIILNDGTILHGNGFGYPKTVFGELVFNTGMVGYPETITDPSYNGQILMLTYPLIGNYGVPDTKKLDKNGINKYIESDKIQIKGLIIHELSSIASHWNIKYTLDEWLYNEKIPMVTNIDTRELTKKLRKKGVMMGALIVSEKNNKDEKIILKQLRNTTKYDLEQFMQYNNNNHNKNTFGSGKKKVVIIDAGVKNAILRNILDINYKIIKVPWNADIKQILSYKPDGVIISNGPGDPIKCKETIETAKYLLDYNIPTLGICLGAQILGLAGNAKTFKLKYGHRGQNKPCINVENSISYITSQNHGYCIELNSLKNSEFKLWFINTDDNTVEGIKHKKKKCIAVQFHPEASPGPYDCKHIFNEFKKLMEEKKSET